MKTGRTYVFYCVEYNFLFLRTRLPWPPGKSYKSSKSGWLYGFSPDHPGLRGFRFLTPADQLWCQHQPVIKRIYDSAIKIGEL